MSESIKPVSPVGSQVATIYCSYRAFYWFARCPIRGLPFETRMKTHGSARQAADEICALLRANGQTVLKLVRIYSKQYVVHFVPKEGGKP